MEWNWNMEKKEQGTGKQTIYQTIGWTREQIIVWNRKQSIVQTGDETIV